ncbi:hypothetical protein RvY_15441 [Ramazzottius varieornatus]|uniref:Mediator of RNA polymerase II transcription subunit 7 n=1 Tax=Ramazzottius varieornatus TaxID=947166 RepID=A0A1D1VWI4_RAMVA|nr:hypothetical protein RvY_15441 [Ramazzottius varieornatus]
MAGATDRAGVVSDEQRDLVQSVFPAPPLEYFERYFNLDEEDAVDDVKEPTEGNEHVNDEILPALPSKPARRKLPSPPPIPEDGCTAMFNDLLTPNDTLIRDLELDGIERLGEDGLPRKKLLKRLMWSAVMKLMEILDCLTTNPSSEFRKQLTDDLHTIFINFHYTLNLYRPAQAKESLVQLLKLQMLRNVSQTEVLLQTMSKAIALIEGVKSEPNSEELDSKMDVDVSVDHLGTGRGFEVDVSSFRVVMERLRSDLAAVRVVTETFLDVRMASRPSR